MNLKSTFTRFSYVNSTILKPKNEHALIISSGHTMLFGRICICKRTRFCHKFALTMYLSSVAHIFAFTSARLSSEKRKSVG